MQAQTRETGRAVKMLARTTSRSSTNQGISECTRPAFGPDLPFGEAALLACPVTSHTRKGGGPAQRRAARWARVRRGVERKLRTGGMGRGGRASAGRNLAEGRRRHRCERLVEDVDGGQAVTPVEVQAADRAWAPGGGGSKRARMQSKREYTTVKNGATQPTSRLNAPTIAICWDAAARAQNSVAGEGG